MNRTDLQQIAMRRLSAARALMESGHWDSAYYLAGYAVECGLKACIARQVREYDFPDKKAVEKSFTHDLTLLVRVAGLEQQRLEAEQSGEFKINWATVKDWSENSRYRNHGRQAAEALVDAIDGTPDGVMAWIRQHW